GPGSPWGGGRSFSCRCPCPFWLGLFWSAGARRRFGCFSPLSQGGVEPPHCSENLSPASHPARRPSAPGQGLVVPTAWAGLSRGAVGISGRQRHVVAEPLQPPDQVALQARRLQPVEIVGTKVLVLHLVP